MRSSKLKAKIEELRCQNQMSKSVEAFAAEVEERLNAANPDWTKLTAAQNKANLEQIEVQNSKVLKILQAKDEKV